MLDENQLQSIKQRFGIIGHAPKLDYAIRVAAQVAPTDMSVLITGESGSGKESFSKIIHQLSPRKHGPFIAINCGAIPEGTIDSELFGHEKGAFTGAQDSRKGYFEETDKGTIFLDEIGEMPKGTQARLLRVLENGEYIKVGSSKVLKTNVRVVAATNVNLTEAVEKGKFREDLYYRLSTVPIYVPPLRERGDDVNLLFRKFASDISDAYRIKPVVLNDEARELLRRYRFPGNIRQLKNIVDRLSVLEMERVIDVPVLQKYLPKEDSLLPALYTGRQTSSGESFTERDLLYKVLFDMRQDVNEMKKLIFQLIKSGQMDSTILDEHPRLFDTVKENFLHPEENVTKTANSDKNGKFIIKSTGESQPEKTYQIDIEDVVHEDEEESLSLEKKEKEMIIKALKKNNNKRKYAAIDLGISERTLYRKIKQYELE